MKSLLIYEYRGLWFRPAFLVSYCYVSFGNGWWIGDGDTRHLDQPVLMPGAFELASVRTIATYSLIFFLDTSIFLAVIMLWLRAVFIWAQYSIENFDESTMGLTNAPSSFICRCIFVDIYSVHCWLLLNHFWNLFLVDTLAFPHVTILSVVIVAYVQNSSMHYWEDD